MRMRKGLNAADLRNARVVRVVESREAAPVQVMAIRVVVAEAAG
jgi:hypothetical protein